MIQIQKNLMKFYHQYLCNILGKIDEINSKRYYILVQVALKIINYVKILPYPPLFQKREKNNINTH